MIYGLYLSATGIITSSHQQDVIANNIANADTNGFKRELALQEERRVESQARHTAGVATGGLRNPLLDNIGGGQLLAPSYVDKSQGELAPSSNNFDTAVFGTGYLAVQEQGQLRLTRQGSMLLDKDGNLKTTAGQQVLDKDRKPIQLKGFQQGQLAIQDDGSIHERHGDSVETAALATIGLLEPTDPQSIKPVGGNLFAPTKDTQLVAAKGVLKPGMTEQSNVDPTTELTRLMETQRLLEANANMIRTQDSTLGRAVNDVGKIS